MPSFPYVARTSDGTLERGSIDAADAAKARELLHDKGWTVEELAGDTSVSFTEAPAWTVTEQKPKTSNRSSATEATPGYIPLTQTLRLFAGWLMAWYGIIYLAGSYRADGRIPYDIPAIQGLSESPLVLRFAFGTFLFLLLTDIHRKIGEKAIGGVLLAIIGVVLMWMFHLNI